jgi:hypothetical protein
MGSGVSEKPLIELNHDNFSELYSATTVSQRVGLEFCLEPMPWKGAQSPKSG